MNTWSFHPPRVSARAGGGPGLATDKLPNDGSSPVDRLYKYKKKPRRAAPIARVVGAAWVADSTGSTPPGGRSPMVCRLGLCKRAYGSGASPHTTPCTRRGVFCSFGINSQPGLARLPKSRPVGREEAAMGPGESPPLASRSYAPCKPCLG